MTFKGKVALVTGGAQGIGLAVVKGFLKCGAKVAFLDIQKDVGENTVNELEKDFGTKAVSFYHCDVSNLNELEDCFKKTVENFGRLDVVVNNAGIINESYPHWRKCIDVNLCAMVRGTELGLQYMSKENGHQGGFVINTSSTASLGPLAPVPVYSATKAFINQFTRSYGTEEHYKVTGVKVMAVLPDLTDTPMIRQSPGLVIQRLRQLWNEINDVLIPQNPSSLFSGIQEMIKEGTNGSLWIVEDDKKPKKIELRFD